MDSFTAEANQTYYILLSGYGSSDKGDFALEVSCEVIYDCPDLQANIGDACDDGDPNTENDMIVEGCGCTGTPVITPPTPVCDNFVYFLSDHASADDVSDIYKVTLSGGEAILDHIITSDIEVHIAYNPADNLLYAVSRDFHSYRTLDPYAASPEFGPAVDLGDDLTQITAAVFNADGKLLVGSQNQNKIWSVNVSTNVVSLYDAYAPVQGGDLAYSSDGMLYLATRTGSGLYEVYPDDVMPDQLLPGPGVPDNVTGMAITDIDQLLVSSRDNTNLVLRNTDGSDAGSYAVTLNGEPFTLQNGDMASGCDTHQNVEECTSFSIFYSNHTSSASSDLYSVTINGADADLSLLTTVDFEEHIAFNATAGIVYLVNADGSFVRSYDPVGNITIGDLPILGDVGNLYAAVYNPEDGLLYVGDAGANKIYTISLVDGTTTFFANAPIEGGDLAIQDGVLYLATRQGDKLYEIVGGGSPVLVGSIPANVNGMAKANNSTTLLTSNAGASAFSEINAADGSTVNSYNAILNGESFTMTNGDMASGCAAGGNSGNTCDYKLYYVHTPSGGGDQPLLEVTLNNDGTASYNAIIANIGGHIGLSPDGTTIYNVGGSDLKVIDVATGSVVNTVNIQTAVVKILVVSLPQ